jgi:hypothetical protein
MVCSIHDSEAVGSLGVDYNNNLFVKSTKFFAAYVPVYKIIELKNSCPTFAF